MGRLLAVYRVDEAVVYDDRGYWREGDVLVKVLEYMVAPPYLRRRIFPPSIPELRYAGVLPPLQTPTHGVGGPRDGEIREAVVVGVRGLKALLDAGLGYLVEARLPRGLRLQRGDKVLVRLRRLDDKFTAELVKDEPQVYIGYRVKRVDSLRRLLRLYSKCLRVGTSKRGRAYSVEFYEKIVKEAVSRGCLLIVFGAPDAGLYELAGIEGFNIENEVDYMVNLIPCQGTLTVRTEEAVAAALTLVNLAEYSIMPDVPVRA